MDADDNMQGESDDEAISVMKAFLDEDLGNSGAADENPKTAGDVSTPEATADVPMPEAKDDASVKAAGFRWVYILYYIYISSYV